METLDKLHKNGIRLSYEDVAFICRKYGIKELSVFGSSLRDDFTASSDIDILVSFHEDASVDLFDLIDLENEFTELLGRPVDIVEKESLRNPIRRRKILETCESVYAA